MTQPQDPKTPPKDDQPEPTRGADKPPAPPEPRDETHDSIDPQTGALLDPAAHAEFHAKAKAATSSDPKKG